MEKPLLNFRENFKKDMKKYDHHIADLRKQLVSRYAAVEKVKTNQAYFNPGLVSHEISEGYKSTSTCVTS